MVHVMTAWKGRKPDAFSLAAVPLVGQQEFEDAVTKYYCQQFYCYFGRAAQVPHRLFQMDSLI